MGWGIVLLAFLILPAVLSTLEGYKQFSHFAEYLVGKEDLAEEYHGHPWDAGLRLLVLCRRLSWIGLAFFALGLRRFTDDLTAKAAYPTAD